MDEALGHEITQLLQAWRQGDERVLEKLTPQVYRELHRAAKHCMARERDGHTLQATALINELYLRLSDLKLIDWQNRAHFFGMAAQAMRHILVDYARARHAAKRGGGAHEVSFDEAAMVTAERVAEVVALDDALDGLANLAPRQSRVVELRYFGGLSVKETAEVLGVSAESVKRDWRMAKVWLLRELQRSKD